MSWHWSRLSTLVFLVLLYASPLSSGDKGLWLSVTALPVQVFAATPDRLPAEHAILLPDHGGLVRTTATIERRESAPALAGRPLAAPTPSGLGSQVDHAPRLTAFGVTSSAPAAPRAPPA